MRMVFGKIYKGGHSQFRCAVRRVRTIIAGCVTGIFAVLGGGAAGPYYGVASANDGVPELAPTVTHALLHHPQVAEANARVCQAVHRLGLNRAEARPQLGLSISGGRQILERVKGQNGRPDRRGRSESGKSFSQRDDDVDVDDEASGAHRRDYAHRARDHIYDGTLSVRYNLVDWGQSRNAIEAQRLRHQVARIDAENILAERSFQLLTLALRLALFDRVVQTQLATTAVIGAEVTSIEARVAAGAGRLAELREAKLLLLDSEIDINRVSAQRDQVLERLAFDYNLGADDAAHLLDVYTRNRPEPLIYLDSAEISRVRALRLQITATEHEERQIKGARYMQVDGVLDGTVFDLADYEDEYEMVGRLEFRMPLYDGGTARARLRETAWRGRELKSSVQTQQRAHSSESELVALQFHQLAREIGEETARLAALESRRESVQARQGQTIVSPLELANLQMQIGRTEARLIELQMEQEQVRGRALFLAEELTSVLRLNLGDNGC
jgi:outer membrane protein TolC